MEKRVLIYAPTGQDAPLTARMLAMARIDSTVCATLAEVARQLPQGAGCVLTVEEALAPGGFMLLHDCVAQQPTWSDLPILLLTHRGADSLAVRQAVAALGNLTLLERPVRTLTLITSLHALLRARDKQYQVREAARRKDEFLASLGHELRNPLAPIRTSVALLNHLYPDVAQVERIGGVIERQVTHLTRLVDDLLDVARITSGKIALQRERIGFKAVIGHVHELCAQAAAAKQIPIELNLPERDLTLDADYARVVQIFANILSNAVKFTPPRGRIALRAWREERSLCVSIADNGIGIDAASLPRIFGMFEQSATVSGQMSSGLGIGLSLSRQFAQMHGGCIEARSDGAGQGSEFLIRLPVISSAGMAAAAPATPHDDADATTAPQRARVLVADDNRDAADALRALLEMEGYEAEAAYDGQAALDAVIRAVPDLIVMDLGMPGMDGYDAARAIRRQAGAEDVLMIALTGWGQSDARHRTIEAGFDHHLIKPVDVDEILKLASARATADGGGSGV